MRVVSEEWKGPRPAAGDSLGLKRQVFFVRDVACQKPGRCAVTSNGLIVRCLPGVGRSLQAYCGPQGGSFIYFMVVPSALVELPASCCGSWGGKGDAEGRRVIHDRIVSGFHRSAPD
ncbi:hypothetical protein AB2M95_02520 [Pseudomonas chlororaphis]|uniref:hypothetical protein n=1 Tax=Pseudomonas chlororaphis TaxID=587753 RepID=UPI0034629559